MSVFRGSWLGFVVAGAFSVGCNPLGLIGAERGEPIPAGAQQVHVTIADSTVRLTPSTVKAGDVYLVVDAPPNGQLTFVSGIGSGKPPDAPLAPGALERLARGDTQGTSISGFEAGGCDDAQNLEDRGKTGPCGNVMKVVVAPGNYGVMVGSPDGLGAGAGPISVLTVMP